MGWAGCGKKKRKKEGKKERKEGRKKEGKEEGRWAWACCWAGVENKKENATAMSALGPSQTQSMMGSAPYLWKDP